MTTITYNALINAYTIVGETTRAEFWFVDCAGTYCEDRRRSVPPSENLTVRHSGVGFFGVNFYSQVLFPKWNSACANKRACIKSLDVSLEEDWLCKASALDFRSSLTASGRTMSKVYQDAVVATATENKASLDGNQLMQAGTLMRRNWSDDAQRADSIAGICKTKKVLMFWRWLRHPSRPAVLALVVLTKSELR